MLFWLRTRSVFHGRRRSFSDPARKLRALQRISLIESATAKPTDARAVTSSSAPLSASAAVRSLDAAVEATYGDLTDRLAAAQRASAAPRVASLSRFLAEGRRMRRAMAETRALETRRLLRRALRAFWADHAAGAVACCALRGRDFGHVAALGLSDDALRVPLAALHGALEGVRRERRACAGADMMLALHFMARELRCAEVQRARGETPAAQCVAFRRALASLGLERIQFFLLQQRPSGRVLGTARDALHALEFLTLVKVHDAESSVRAQLTAAKPWRGEADDQYIVTRLFRHIASNQGDLNFTSIVHAFKLLRVFLPLLSTPPGHGKRWTEEVKGMETNLASPFATSDADKTFGAWHVQRDAVDHVIWGLSTALWRKDRRFVNAFHFVQVMATLSRLPPFLLSRPPRPRPRHLRQLTTPMKWSTNEMENGHWNDPSEAHQTDTQGVDHAHVDDQEGEDIGVQGGEKEEGNMTKMRPEEFWEYMVAKACIFIPNLTSEQRRHACRGLRLAVQRRERYFDVSQTRKMGLRRGGKRALSVSETILMPMAHELSHYPEDYQLAMLDHPQPEKGNIGHA